MREGPSHNITPGPEGFSFVTGGPDRFQGGTLVKTGTGTGEGSVRFGS